MHTMFFDEMSLMIAKHKYLENIWNVRAFVDISEINSFMSKSSMYRKEKPEFVQ